MLAAAAEVQTVKVLDPAVAEVLVTAEVQAVQQQLIEVQAEAVAKTHLQDLVVQAVKVSLLYNTKYY